MITPSGEKRMTVIGSEMMPISINTELITPWRPSTGRMANTRTSSEIMNGRMNSNITRCCAALVTRRRMNTAIGKPMANEIATAAAACSMENR